MKRKGFNIKMKNTVKTILVSASVATGMFILGTQVNADTVTVTSGDTVSEIAQEYGDTVNHIASVNQLANPNFIQVGETLQVGTSSQNNGTSEASNGYSSVANTESNAGTSEVQNKPNTGYAPASTSGNVAEQAAQLMAQKTGVSASEWSYIIQRESNGTPSAQNPSSSAHGLFQQLGETSNDWRTQVNDAAELYSKQGLNAWAETK